MPYMDFIGMNNLRGVSTEQVQIFVDMALLIPRIPIDCRMAAADLLSEGRAAYFWQRGQLWVLRPPMIVRRIGVPQTRQGSPVRP
jgi:hypothetical protein